jgi:tetratricopeptide (TPR) repeat protein
MPSRLEMLRAFATQRPHDPFPRYALAQELKTSGDLSAAAQALVALTESHPDYVPAYFHAGVTLSELGEPARAREILTRGLEACTRAGDLKTRNEIEGALAGLGELR